MTGDPAKGWPMMSVIARTTYFRDVFTEREDGLVVLVVCTVVFLD